MSRISLFVLSVLFVATAALAVAAEPVNLLANGKFEAKDGGDDLNAADWIESGAASRETWSGRNAGEFGMALRCWEATGTGEAYQEIKAKEGTEYTFKISACRDAGNFEGEFYLKLAWYNGDKLLNEDIQKVVLADSWDKYVLSAKAPPKANKVRVVFGSKNVSLTGKFTEAECAAK